MKVYTKKGDDGTTGLIDGSRVRKDHLRVAAYGDVDELNAVLGVVRTQVAGAALGALLHGVQRDLFAIGAQLADPKASVGSRKTKAAVTAGDVERLERAIDEREGQMPPLRVFILPGGSPTGALLHLARTTCRRAERTIVALARRQKVNPIVVAYINRLSDLLFVLARHENQASGKAEEPW